MRAVLVVTSGERAGDRVELDESLVIGRAGADLVLDDAEISRRHALIRNRDDRFEIEDLGSRNGTHVDGETVHRATLLTHGAQIRIGRTDLRFEIPPEATATVLSDLPQLSEAGATAASEPRRPLVESPLFAGQASAPPRSVASRQSAVMAATFSMMLLVPIALLIYFWRVG